jgi:hypothetical protein
MTTTTTTSLRFYYNGIKANAGAKLEKAHFTGSEQMVVIYGRHYASFSRAISEALNVKNDSDIMTDYFVNDRICLTPEHRYFAAAYAALQASEAKTEARRAQRAERNAQASR